MPKTPVGNGEHAAASAEKQAAKEQAAAEQAAKEQAATLLAPLTASAVEACNEYIEAEEAKNVAHLALGFAVLAVEDSGALEVLGRTIAEYCETELAEVSTPSFGTSAAYRALQAARVAQSVRGSIGSTSTDALRPMHRVKDVPGATSKVFAAAKVAAGRGKVVRKRHVEDALEKLFPKDDAASPGPKKGSAKPKQSAPRNTPTADVVEVPDLAVSATRLQAAQKRMEGILSASEQPSALMVAAATAKCCSDYGIAATVTAITTIGTPKKQAAKKPAAAKK